MKTSPWNKENVQLLQTLSRGAHSLYWENSQITKADCFRRLKVVWPLRPEPTICLQAKCNIIRKLRFLGGFERSIQANQKVRFTTQTKKKNVSTSTFQRGWKHLGVISYAMGKKHIFDGNDEESQSGEVWKVLSWLKSDSKKTDSKIFTVDRTTNTLDDQWITLASELCTTYDDNEASSQFSEWFHTRTTSSQNLFCLRREETCRGKLQRSGNWNHTVDNRQGCLEGVHLPAKISPDPCGSKFCEPPYEEGTRPVLGERLVAIEFARPKPVLSLFLGGHELRPRPVQSLPLVLRH